MNNDPIFTMVGSRKGLVSRVTNEIRGLITQGKLVPGMNLPPQVELARQLGVSLTVMREAIRHLQAEGFLETKPGVGTRVRKVTPDQIVKSLNSMMQSSGNKVQYNDLYQVRTILETEIVAIAAVNATREDIEKLEKNISEMALSIDNPEAIADLDVAFHEALAQITNNNLLIILIGTIMELSRQYLRVINTNVDVQRDIYPFHLEIIAQIESGSVDGAREAMREHLEQARRNHEKAVDKLLAGNTKEDQANGKVA